MLFPPVGAFYYAATVAAILLTTLFYGMNSGLRDEVNQAISPSEVPERLTRGYSQKQFQEFQKLEKHRDVHLEQNRRQGHRKHHPGAEPRDLSLPLAAEENAVVGIGH